MAEAAQQPHIDLATATGLWAQQDYCFGDGFLSSCRDAFAAEVQLIDFGSRYDAVLDQINGWASRQTQCKIKEALLPGDFTSDIRLVFVNTLYFKGQWASRFSMRQTQDQPFKISPEHLVQSSGIAGDSPSFALAGLERNGYPPGMDAREALVVLNLVEHVGPVRVRQLLEHFGDAPAILRASRHQLLQVRGIGEDTAEAIAGWESATDLGAELKRVEEFGCHIVTQEDEEYPELLRQIYDPPIVLYVKGQLSAKDKNSVAMVGSRMTTHYGIETARKLAYQLAYLGVTVVSGGARGIDTAAHQGTLSGKGRTVAVLGTGINLVTPPENAKLFEQIAANGALVTQFPFNRPADKQSFPIRNRIVAGMTLGTVVVEANLTSGALITANFATEYGRQVFAVPGRIDSPRSKGCHDLIKKGAKLCEGAEDILSEFEYLFPASNRALGAGAGNVLPAAVLSEPEQRVYDMLDNEESSIDEVIRKSGLPSSAVSVALLSLEMKRLVRQLPGKLFVRNS